MYAEDLAERVRGAASIAALFRRAENLDTLLAHPSLLQVRLTQLEVSLCMLRFLDGVDEASNEASLRPDRLACSTKETQAFSGCGAMKP